MAVEDKKRREDVDDFDDDDDNLNERDQPQLSRNQPGRQTGHGISEKDQAGR